MDRALKNLGHDFDKFWTVFDRIGPFVERAWTEFIHFWTKFGHVLDRFFREIRQLGLEKFRTGIGKKLDIAMTRLSQFFDRAWTAFGQLLDGAWTGFGQSLDSFWAAFG